MKRKFKLFATIASLCMAVALMAFGVYAAQSVAYQLNGSVTYEVNDVYVTISTQVHYLKNSKVGYANETAVTSASGEWAQVTEGVPGEYNNGTQPGAANESGKTDSLPAFEFNTSTLYKITVTVQSRQAEELSVTPEITSTEENLTLVNATETTIAGNDSEQYTFYVALEDATKAITGASFNIKLTITQSEAQA